MLALGLRLNLPVSGGLVEDEGICVFKAQIFSQGVEGISVKLGCALEKKFVRIFRSVLVNCLGVIFCCGTCRHRGIYYCQNFEGCFL